jgi:hypothetical protein
MKKQGAGGLAGLMAGDALTLVAAASGIDPARGGTGPGGKDDAIKRRNVTRQKR